MKRIRVLTATDIHQTKWMYQALEEAVRFHKPDVLALVGDFLFGGIPRSDHYSEKECASRLAAMPCEVVFARGNHEMNNWEPFVDRWLKTGRALNIPHGDATVIGPLVIVGFPCTFGNEESFLMGRKSVDYDVTTWLPNLLKQHGAAARTLWLMHEPPAYTKLCEPEGLMAGVDEWSEAIERYQPWLTISGHDHETPVFDGSWRDQLGRTTCLNLGQLARLTKEWKTLHYSLMDFEFAGAEPALPQQVTITAYPWRETFVLPNGQKLGPDQ